MKALMRSSATTEWACMKSLTWRTLPASRSVGVGEDVEGFSLGVGFDSRGWRKEARSS